MGEIEPRSIWHLPHSSRQWVAERSGALTARSLPQSQQNTGMNGALGFSSASSLARRRGDMESASVGVLLIIQVSPCLPDISESFGKWWTVVNHSRGQSQKPLSHLPYPVPNPTCGKWESSPGGPGSRSFHYRRWSLRGISPRGPQSGDTRKSIGETGADPTPGIRPF